MLKNLEHSKEVVTGVMRCGPGERAELIDLGSIFMVDDNLQALDLR